jgi:nicotinate-nucleotide adenylyltransferase
VWHPNDVFTLVLGVDTLAEMSAWRDTETIFELSDIVAIARPGYATHLPPALLAKHPGVAKRVKVLDAPASDVSASDVRVRLAAQESIEGLVPSTVAAYIQRHGLYGATKRL